MKVTFLGTGTSQGVPVIACDCEVCKSKDPRDKRLRTSVLIEVDGKSFVIDCGPDFRQQMLNANVQILDAVIYTHEHKDHTAGLDDVRAFNFKQNKPMMLYAHDRVKKAIIRDFGYIFSEHDYPGLPKIEFTEIDNLPFECEGVKVTPISVLHYKLPVLGFRIKDFVYITDANFILPEEKLKIKGCKVLVLNSLRKEKHISHFTLDEAVELVEELKPEQAYLTHISHLMGTHEETQKLLPDNIKIAHDGLKLNL